LPSSAFLGDALVFGNDALDGAGEHGNGRHHLADAFLDAFGDFDLAFAGQQLDGAHFAHVHAHWVGGAANVAFNGGECGSGFFSGGLVGVVIGEQKSIGIGCSLEDRDSDVFNLFRICDILRPTVVDFRVGQVALLATAGSELFETGLLVRFSGHNSPMWMPWCAKKEAADYTLKSGCLTSLPDCQFSAVGVCLLPRSSRSCCFSSAMSGVWADLSRRCWI